MSSAARRRLEILTPAGVTFAAVMIVVMASPLIDRFGWFSRPCSLREVTGLPCLACGGTRSVQALASGEVMEALRFNPLVFVGVCVAAVWLARALWRAWKWTPEDSGNGGYSFASVRWWLIGLGVAAIANWLYLWKYLPD